MPRVLRDNASRFSTAKYSPNFDAFGLDRLGQKWPFCAMLLYVIHVSTYVIRWLAWLALPLARTRLLGGTNLRALSLSLKIEAPQLGYLVLSNDVSPNDRNRLTEQPRFPQFLDSSNCSLAVRRC